MSETRYIEEYKDSKLINKIPYEVSDEQLAVEQKAQRLQELKAKVKTNILTEPEKDEVIKLILDKI